MDPLSLSIISSIAIGIGHSYMKIVIPKIGSERFIFMRGAMLSILLLLLLFVGFGNPIIDINGVLIAIVVSIIGAMGLLFFTRGVEQGTPSVVSAVSSSRIPLTALIAATLLNESISQIASLGILVVVFGLILISDVLKKQRISQTKLSSAFIYGFIAAVFWGVSSAFIGIPSALLGALLFTFILELIVALVGFVLMLSKEHRILPKDKFFKDYWGWLVLMTILGLVGSLSMNIAYETGRVSVVASVVAANPLITIISDRIILGTKLRLIQYVAIVTIIVGITMIIFG
ncbi:MAG: EamA family transporter [Candidatus Dojkabacteria bacterium]|nr:MAG: EamA family transporter [Candidatus Dojkabacteria bacterium]